MTKKDKVEFVRTEEFDTVDQALAEAMALLDQVNTRVIDLLQGERPPAPGTSEGAPVHEDGSDAEPMENGAAGRSDA